MRGSVQERFWSKVDVGAPSDCWVWTAGRSRKGYGHFRAYGKIQLAPRVAWRLTKGDIPVGIFVLHNCDNPPCVNPAHLKLGTNSDNMRDRAARGRQAGGGRKLTAEQVAQAREQHSRGIKQAALAAQLGVTIQAVSLFINRRTWTQTGGAL